MTDAMRGQGRRVLSVSAAILVATMALAAGMRVATAAGGHDERIVAATRFVDELPAYVPLDQVDGTLSLWGHGSFKRDFMGNLVTAWIAEFRRHQPGVAFDYRMYGTASAVGAVYMGVGDIALLGEEISPAAAKAFLRAKGYAHTEFPIATGSLDVNYYDYAHMVFVHRDNPLARLSLRELDAIFGNDHRRGTANIRNWGALGLDGEWKAQPIHPHGWKTDVDFALFFRERVLENSHRWNPAIREYVNIMRADGTQYDHGQQIVDAVARDRYAIGISNLRYATDQVRALPLAWSDDGPAVEPTPATLIDQSYPLVRIIPAIVDQAPGKPLKPAVREFLRFVLSREGQRILLAESGYLPLGRRFIEEQRARLEP
ncbi:MAG: substrate-binding domain-containing protein [Steroidobacteraceae bacterium]